MSSFHWSSLLTMRNAQKFALCDENTALLQKGGGCEENTEWSWVWILRGNSLMNHCNTVCNRMQSKKKNQTDHTKPPPSQKGCSSITFLHIILAAKWLVQHSSTSPKQLRQPMPSLLSNSSSLNKMYSLTWLEAFGLTYIRLSVYARVQGPPESPKKDSKRFLRQTKYFAHLGK